MHSSPQRTRSNEILIYLSPQQLAPSVPFEVSNQVSADKWAARVNAVNSLAGRFSKPKLERIWLTIGMLLMFVVPLALHWVVLSLVPERANGTMRHMEASSIGLAIFVAMGCLVFFPISAWKFTGRKRMNSLVSSWNKADSVQFGQNAIYWNVQTPGVFHNKLILTIVLPPSLAPSTFHPDAYLPSYINAPNDVDAVYYYPFKAEAGLPRMSVVGNVPIYSDEKRAFADHKV